MEHRYADWSQSQPGDVARRLGYLRSFKSAADEFLAQLRQLRREAFAKQSRKILTLIEIARKTLSSGGVKLHLFTSCAPALQPLKDVYFDLLRSLKEHRNAISEPRMQERADRLLLPLSTWMVIRRAADSKPYESEDPLRTPPISWPPHSALSLGRPKDDDGDSNTLMPPPPSPRRSRVPSSRTSFHPERKSGPILSLAPRLYARTRLPRRNAPIDFEPHEVGQSNDGDEDTTMDNEDDDVEIDVENEDDIEDDDDDDEFLRRSRFERPASLALPMRQKFGPFSSPWSRPRERGVGHFRRRSVHGI